ncbi:MAG: hypothetical protein IJF49_08490 [Clostridia bacterium]|nr:hypothetical protein [Clostridia bacterium]
MASIYLSTAGILVGYGVETTAGAQPTSFAEIPDLTSIGSVNPEPQTIDVTPLSETTWRRYIDALKDVGGAIPFGANLSDKFIEAWSELLEAHKTAKASGKQIWFVFYIPGLSKSFAMCGNPAELGFDGAEVGNAAKTTAYITPTLIKGFVDKVTVTTAE